MRETNPKKAQTIAESFELAARQRMTEGQIRRVISDLYERMSGNKLPSSSVREFFEGWIDRKRLENGKATAARYGEVARQFVSQMGTEQIMIYSLLRAKMSHCFETRRPSV